MELNVKYRGRIATTEDVALIKELIEENPNISRWALSKKLCQAWNWRQANGHLRDMICRSFLLRLEEAGYIQLPPRKIPSPFVRKKPSIIDFDQTPINASLSNIKPLQILQVRRTPFEKIYNSLIQQFHYLKYTQPVGEHLKHIVFSNKKPIACFAFSSAPRHIGCRDKFIGWSPSARKKNLHLIAYNNTRFQVVKILPNGGIQGGLVKMITSLIDFSFVRSLVADCYSAFGPPPYDPPSIFLLDLFRYIDGNKKMTQFLPIIQDEDSGKGL